MLSIAAAVIVTRVSSPLDLTGQMSSQFSSAGAWTPVAVILALLGCLPGMPHFILLPAAGIAGYVAYPLKPAKTAAGSVPAAAYGPGAADPAQRSETIREDGTDPGQLCGAICISLIGLGGDKLTAPLWGRP